MITALLLLCLNLLVIIDITQFIDEKKRKAAKEMAEKAIYGEV